MTGSFAFLTEVYGGSGPLLDQRLRETLANGAVLHPALDEEERRIVEGNRRPFAYFAIPAEADVATCYPQSSDSDAAGTLRELGVTAQSGAWRLGTPEFDQGGGCWAQNRPSLAGLPDDQAYATWSRFYLDAKALRPVSRAVRPATRVQVDVGLRLRVLPPVRVRPRIRCCTA